MAARRIPRRQDTYGKRARKEGYPARSVYKLEEMDQRMNLIRRGDRVLDLGAFPGSWSLYASRKVGPQGKVLGLDLQAHKGAAPPNVEFRQLDIFAAEVHELGGPKAFDVVMSDMAPATVGHRATDQARSFTLVMEALDVALKVLRPGGTFVAKIFQGEDFPAAKKTLQDAFQSVRVMRPKAIRSESYEVYLVGQGVKEEALREAPPPPEADSATSEPSAGGSPGSDASTGGASADNDTSTNQGE